MHLSLHWQPNHKESQFLNLNKVMNMALDLQKLELYYQTLPCEYYQDSIKMPSVLIFTREYGTYESMLYKCTFPFSNFYVFSGTGASAITVECKNAIDLQLPSYLNDTFPPASHYRQLFDQRKSSRTGSATLMIRHGINFYS